MRICLKGLLFLQVCVGFDLWIVVVLCPFLCVIWMSDLEYVPIDCKTILGLREIALILSGRNFLRSCMSVG